MTPIGFYRPDLAPTNPGVSLTVLNAILRKDTQFGVNYGPQPSLGILSAAEALPSAPRGATSTVSRAGLYRVYVGTVDKLFEVSPEGGVTEIGTGYTLPDGDHWSMCQFGDYVYFTNTNDGLMRYSLVSGGTVDPVAGAPLIRIIFPLFNTLCGLDCDGDNRVLRTSKINDPTVWSGDPSCRHQEFAEGEALTGGGELGQYGAVVLQRNAVRVLSRLPNAGLFTVSLLASGVGAQAPQGVTIAKGWCYFMDTDGPQRTNGSEIEAIGEDKIANTMVGRLAAQGTETTQTAYDPVSKRVLYRYQSEAAIGDVYRDILAYDLGTGEWVPIEMETTFLVALATAGYGIDDLDVFGTIDTLPYPLDSRVWMGGEPRVGAFNADFKFGFLDGPNLACTLETGAIAPGNTIRVTRATPFTDAVEATVQMGFKRRLADDFEWGLPVGIDEDGEAPVDEAGNVIAFRLNVPAGVEWTFMRGFEFLKARPRGLAYK